MEKIALLYDDVFLRHETPPWHPECKKRLIAIINTLKASPIWESLIHIRPKKATLEEVSSVHSYEYIEQIKNAKAGYLDPDTYLGEDSLTSALYAVGAVVSAIDNCKKGALRRAFCAIRPPGHHAEKEMAMGFCIFNNIAVGARHAQEIGYRKVFIVDFDVHHGNGTQHIFEEDDSVFYFSTHQYPHYPGTGDYSEKGIGKGRGFTFNIPLPSGSGDKQYHSAYHEVLPDLMRVFEPNIVLISAGYDIHMNDPLSGMRVTNEGIREIVKGIFKGPDVPYIFCLEGGYDLNALREGVLITLKEMLLN